MFQNQNPVQQNMYFHQNAVNNTVLKIGHLMFSAPSFSTQNAFFGALPVGLVFAKHFLFCVQQVLAVNRQHRNHIIETIDYSTMALTPTPG